MSKRTLQLLLVVALGAIVAFIAAMRRQPATVDVTVDPSQRFQVFRGWEATSESGLDDASNLAYVPELLDDAVELGLTRLRVEVRSSIENSRDIAQEFKDGRLTPEQFRCLRYATVNDDGDPQTINAAGFRFARLDTMIETIVLPLRDRLSARGQPLWLNFNYVAFPRQLCDGGRYIHDQPGEYAEFVLAVYQHVKEKYDITPDSWEVVLEPDNTREWTGSTMGEAMLQSAARLREAGFTPSFVAPSTTAAAQAVPFMRAMWNREPLRPFIRELSYHRYDVPARRVIDDIGSYAATAGLETSMIEKIGATHWQLNEDLVAGRVSAWQQYTLGFPEPDSGGHYFVIDPDAAEGRRATLSASGHYLREYFRAIRPGAQRIDATASHRDFSPVAFTGADGLAVVVSASRAGRMTLHRLPAGRYRISCWTDQSHDDDAGSRCDRDVTVAETGSLALDMPAPGVVSVVPTR